MSYSKRSCSVVPTICRPADGAVVPIPSLLVLSFQKKLAVSWVMYVPLPKIIPPDVAVAPSSRLSSAPVDVS